MGLIQIFWQASLNSFTWMSPPSPVKSFTLDELWDPQLKENKSLSECASSISLWLGQQNTCFNVIIQHQRRDLEYPPKKQTNYDLLASRVQVKRRPVNRVTSAVLLSPHLISLYRGDQQRFPEVNFTQRVWNKRSLSLQALGPNLPAVPMDHDLAFLDTDAHTIPQFTAHFDRKV